MQMQNTKPDFLSINRLHSSHQSCVKPEKDTAGILTYDAAAKPAKNACLLRVAAFLPRTPMAYKQFILVKYSNGGCSGLEPDSLLHLLSKQLFKPYLPYQYLITINLYHKNIVLSSVK